MLMNAKGWPCWVSTVPTSDMHASVSMAKGMEKSGRAKTGAVDKAVLRVLNAVSCSEVQTNSVFFLSKLVSGQDMMPKFRTNLR